MRYKIVPVGSILSKNTIDFVEKWHYSKSCRSMKQKEVFLLLSEFGELCGVAIYGQPCGANCDMNDLELRRFCLIDDTPKNTESFFLGATLRHLKKKRYTRVITFADPNKGHQGTIYKATNFKFDGLEKNNARVVKWGDRYYHIRQLYQKKDGEYSKDAKRIQDSIKKGEASVLKQERKLRYVYELR